MLYNKKKIFFAKPKHAVRREKGIIILLDYNTSFDIKCLKKFPLKKQNIQTVTLKKGVFVSKFLCLPSFTVLKAIASMCGVSKL